MRRLSYNFIMAYASLYRKYRPSSFEEVIGQESVVRTLRNMVSSGNIAHAYLFTGTRGTGKTSVARIFAKAVNCQNPQNGSPCGECAACRALANAANMDFVELDAASNNSVEDIRALRESVKYPPADEALRYKVYIIDEVHQLSATAFNAFLKTLEEPPAYCIFILATTEVQKLPQTILSRCLRFDFRQVSQEVLAAHVGSIFDREGVRYDREALWAIAAAGAGSVRDTLSVADTCMSAAQGEVSYEQVLVALGANDPKLIAELVYDILTGNLAKALSSVEKSVSLGKSISVLTKDITRYVRDLLIVKSDANANEYLRMPEAAYAQAKTIAAEVDSATLVRALDIFSGLDGNMRLASTPRTVLECAIARTATYSGLALADLSARIGGLEREVDQCKRKLAEGVPVVQVAAPVASMPSEQPNDAATDAPLDTGGMTAVDNPFGDDEEREEPIRTTPNDYMSAKAQATKYRGNLIAALRERKFLLLQSIVDNTYVVIKDNEITYNVADANDVSYCEKSRDLLEELTQNLMGKAYKLIFKHTPPKAKDENGLSNLMSIVGAGKVTKKGG